MTHNMTVLAKISINEAGSICKMGQQSTGLRYGKKYQLMGRKNLQNL